jgi:hypothetical protein
VFLKGIIMSELQNQITLLLGRTGYAHGHYETTVLNGVYDVDWAPWYADWAIQNGLNELLGTSFDADSLGRLFFDINEDHRRDGHGLSWAVFTAQRLVQMFVQVNAKP